MARPLAIVLTGGGSGGHITPLLAVAAELKRLHPDCKLIYIGQRGDALSDIPATSPFIDTVYSVRAGKFRRYHGEGIKQLLDVPTMAKNIRDAGYVLAGIVQSYRLLRKLKPAVIFVKGGFVGVPVGLAAASLKIPFVTHDSDAIPGLANRIIARWAALHAVALPGEVYNYPSKSMVTTGVPVQADFTPVTIELLRKYRQSLQVPADAKVLCVTGGGLGARRVNDAMLAIARSLLAAYPNLVILHIVGRTHQASVQSAYDALLPAEARGRVRVEGYVSNLYEFSGAANVILTRAGATTLAEFAVQQKACIIVPNPVLTAGHQLKNAAYLAKKQAAVFIDEEHMHTDPDTLRTAIAELLDSPQKAKLLAENLHSFARADAAKQLAVVLLEQAKLENLR